jgi:3-isopropylmalate/(R)-2-methylmalate dehydratase small subunit
LFARIFFRNCINIGLPVFESAEAAMAIEQGHEVEADMESGEVRDLTTGKTYRAAGFPPLVQGIIRAGGLVEYARQQLKARKGE